MGQSGCCNLIKYVLVLINFLFWVSYILCVEINKIKCALSVDDDVVCVHVATHILKKLL